MESTPFIAQPNVGTSEESYQASAQSGSLKNGSPLTVEEEVSVSAEGSLGCNLGSASSIGILEKDGNVKPIKEVILASLSKRKCSWGLIWRRKKLDSDSCEDFISRKIIKGNPDMVSQKPTCYYCTQPYDSDLMYIQCETCPSWYHADAVGLEEKRISDLVGFKCCKCRKIRKPSCPYSVPEVKKTQVETSKAKNMDVVSCPGSVQEQQHLLPKSPEETPHATHEHPLPVSSTQSENSQQTYYEQNTAIDSGAQKLPVRRSVKRETDENLSTVDGLGNAGLPTCFKC